MRYDWLAAPAAAVPETAKQLLGWLLTANGVRRAVDRGGGEQGAG